MRNWRVVPIILAIVAAACASSDGSPGGGDGATVDPSAPDGVWQLASGVPLVLGYPITLTVDGHLISGTAACNSYGGAASWGDGSVEIPSTDPDDADMGFGMTEMGCEPEVMASESAYVEALFAVNAWDLDDAILRLTGDGVELVFEPVPVTPASALVGTVWVLDTLIDGDAASSVAGDPAELVLYPDGSLRGSTGCRTLHGEWLQVGAEILFSTFGADGECPDALWEQDNHVVTVLGDGFRPVIDGEFLTLSSMGDIGLRYHASAVVEGAGAEPPPPDEAPEGELREPTLYAACGSVVLEGGLNPVLPTAPLSPEGEAALAQFIGTDDLEFDFFNQFTWSTASETEDELIVFGRPLDGDYADTYADARFERREGSWQPTGWGSCHVTVEAEGWGLAAWQYDPGIEPDADSSQIAVVVNERACANGEPPEGREILPVVIADADRILLTVLIEPIEGDASCPSNPWYPVTLDIGESPDGRPVFDAGVIPAEERIWPPDLEM